MKNHPQHSSPLPAVRYILPLMAALLVLLVVSPAMAANVVVTDGATYTLAPGETIWLIMPAPHESDLFHPDEPEKRYEWSRWTYDWYCSSDAITLTTNESSNFAKVEANRCGEVRLSCDYNGFINIYTHNASLNGWLISNYDLRIEHYNLTIKVEGISITQQPASATVKAGSKAKASVTAIGDGLTYQWYCKAPGADEYTKSASASGKTANFSFTMSDAKDGIQAYCLIKDAQGKSVKTDTVTFRQAVPVRITSQPTGSTVVKGSTARASVAAVGEGLTYRWYCMTPANSTYTKSASASGKTADFSFTMSDAKDGIKVYCLVKDKYGYSAKSDVVTIKQLPVLKLTSQPKGVTVASGAKATVKVQASGDGLTYQWYAKYADASSYSKSSITSATYSVTMNSARNGMKVYCVVKDRYGNSVKSSTATLKRMTPLRITKQPSGVTVASGSKAAVKVQASGDGLTYQWYAKYASAGSYSKSSITSAAYSVTMNSARNGMKVYCVVKDKYGNSVKSGTVTLKMKAPAAKITSQPASVTVASGSKATVKVQATGDGLSYQWYVKYATAGSYSKSSVTSTTYSVTMNDKRDGAQLYCVVKDKYGNSVKSNVVTIRQK